MRVRESLSVCSKKVLPEPREVFISESSHEPDMTWYVLT